MFTQAYFTSFIIAAAIFAGTFSNQAFAAKFCASYKEKIEHYENLRRAGGTMAQMNRWTARGHELEDAQRKCAQDNGSGVIQVASGSETKSNKASKKTEHTALRKSSSGDEQLQRLTQTCNYWITQSNENSSQDNINFREMACNAVDNYQPESTSSNPVSTSNQIAVRKLKDCIKPNNLIDGEVNECLKGNIEPTWKQL